MSLILDLNDMELNKVEEPKAAPADVETHLRIVSVRTGINKNGLPYFMPRFEVVGHPEYAQFSDYVPIPDAQQSEEERYRTTLRLKRFLNAVGVPLTARLDLENDLIGKECWAVLGQEDNPDYGIQNYVKRYITRA
ncbi:MAG: hypothetical protein KatS3mg015_2794 [Fimbriimonadales bacterium]|nr:MAG: hypothetical protein KatS3mg015_2794 [Fimbriimonadales bacterium]